MLKAENDNRTCKAHRSCEFDVYNIGYMTVSVAHLSCLRSLSSFVCVFVFYTSLAVLD